IVDAKGFLLPLDQILGRILKLRPELARGTTASANFFKSVGGVQSTVQARRVFAFLITHLGQYRLLLKQVAADRNELNRAEAAMQQAPSVRFAEAVDQLKAMGLTIGLMVLPAITRLLGH